MIHLDKTTSQIIKIMKFVEKSVANNTATSEAVNVLPTIYGIQIREAVTSQPRSQAL